MKNIFDVPIRDLGEIFIQTAIKMGMGLPSIIEKDFWLVKLLQLLFMDENFQKHHVFKGGTSLSKCFGLIQRFSEDVDITISKALLGFNESDNEVAKLGNKRRNRYFDELTSAAINHVSKIATSLAEQICSQIGGCDWEISIDQEDRQKIIFEYPRSLRLSMYPEDSYIRPQILLEFGCRGELKPSVLVKVITYVEEAFDDVFSEHPVIVTALTPERTFWEKITLLHMLAHQNDSKLLQQRMARHYYDVYKLSRSSVVERAAKNLALLESVAAHKAVYFKSKQASYETARPGSLKLLPSKRLIEELKNDYTGMAEMFFGDMVLFDEILTQLTALENELNKA